MIVRSILGVVSALLVLCTVGGGCQGPSPDGGSSGVGGTAATVDTTAAASGTDSAATDTSRADTSVIAAPPADTSEADTSAGDGPLGGDPPPPAPPPGTARVRGSVVSCDTTAQPARCRIRVETVVGYGAATPPLGSGERTVAVDSDHVGDHPVESLSSLGEQILVLRHAGDQPTFDETEESDRLEWTLDAIEQP